MKSFESKPASLQDRKRRLNSTIRYVAREWAAPMIAWIAVSGIALALVCVLFAPAE
jgi:hypothetical protein